MKRYSIELRGPYSFLGDRDRPVFEQPEVEQPGIYVWAIELEGRYFVHYVGKTKTCMAVRLHWHIKQMFAGVFGLYDPEELQAGVMTRRWGGMAWGKRSWSRCTDFLNRGEELLLIALGELSVYRIFLAPSDYPSRVLERIEAGIAKELRSASGLAGDLFVHETRYNWRRQHETPFKALIKSEVDFAELANELDA